MILAYAMLLAAAANELPESNVVQPSELVSVIETQYDLVKYKDPKLESYLSKTPIQFTTGTHINGKTFDLEEGRQFYFGVLQRLRMLEYRDVGPRSGGPNNVGVSWQSGQFLGFACRFASIMPDELTCSTEGLLEAQPGWPALKHTIIEYRFLAKEIVNIRIISDDAQLATQANKLRKAVD